MEIYRYKPDEILAEKFPVLALGFFDGVHLAHRALIATAVNIAKEEKTKSAVLTFSSEEQGLKEGTKRLYSTENKLDIFAKLGVDAAIVVDFTSVRDLTACDFVKKVLIDGLGCRYAVVGFNFRFGKGAKGNSELLSELMESYGARAVVEKEYKTGDVTVSSTRVRELLSVGKVSEAAEILGSPYFIRGEVTRGLGKGKDFGFPTLNTVCDTTVLQRGVYLTAVELEGELYSGVTNVGVCPTVGVREPHQETYLLNFKGDLYGKRVRIFFLDFLREEKRFNSEKELIMQITVDINNAIKRSGEIKWQEIGLSSPLAEQ